MNQREWDTLKSRMLCYPLEDGPDGMLRVFCMLNFPPAMLSADWDRLMLRFLKNSKPPVELCSCNTHTHTHQHRSFSTQHLSITHLHHLTWGVGVLGGVSLSPEPMAFRKRIMWRHRSHLPCSRAVLKSRVACWRLTAGTSIFWEKNRFNHLNKIQSDTRPSFSIDWHLPLSSGFRHTWLFYEFIQKLYLEMQILL